VSLEIPTCIADAGPFLGLSRLDNDRSRVHVLRLVEFIITIKLEVLL